MTERARARTRGGDGGPRARSGDRALTLADEIQGVAAELGVPSDVLVSEALSIYRDLCRRGERAGATPRGFLDGLLEDRRALERLVTEAEGSPRRASRPPTRRGARASEATPRVSDRLPLGQILGAREADRRGEVEALRDAVELLRDELTGLHRRKRRRRRQRDDGDREPRPRSTRRASAHPDELSPVELYRALRAGRDPVGESRGGVRPLPRAGVNPAPTRGESRPKTGPATPLEPEAPRRKPAELLKVAPIQPEPDPSGRMSYADRRTQARMITF